MWSNDYNVAVPKEGAHVNAQCVCEGDAGDEGETAPSVLNYVEQDEEESSQQQATNDANHDKNTFDVVIAIAVRVVVNLVPGGLVVAIRDNDATQEKAKYEASNVGKVVDVGQKTQQQKNKRDGEEFE